MPKITQIKSQKNKKRVNLYLDGKFGFGLDLENFLKLNLRVEDELTDDQVKKIIKQGEFQKYLDKLLRFASLRPRSRKEINDWLIRKKVHSSIHKDLFNRLKRIGLSNDYEFAKWWVNQRTQFRPRGYRALRSELFLKGISKEIINEVLSETELDEATIARALVKKNSYKWKRFGKLETRQKTSTFLARKGFGWDVIKKVVS